MLTRRYYEFSCRLLLLGEADTAGTVLRNTASQSLTGLQDVQRLMWINLMHTRDPYCSQPAEANVSRQPHETRAGGTKKTIRPKKQCLGH